MDPKRGLSAERRGGDGWFAMPSGAMKFARKQTHVDLPSTPRNNSSRRQFWRLAILAMLVAVVAEGAPASASHVIVSHRDGYDFYYSRTDELNSRNNANRMAQHMLPNFSSGHIVSNSSAFRAFGNLGSLPYIYYHSGHSYYFNGGPGHGGFAAQNFDTGTVGSALTNNPVQTAEVSLFMDAFDVSTAPTSSMGLAVLHGCRTILRDIDGTSPAHAFRNNGLGAYSAFGFMDETWFSVGSSTDTGPDYTWANEFWGRLRAGDKVGIAAQLAADKVVQVHGQAYGYHSWGLVGNNVQLYA